LSKKYDADIQKTLITLMLADPDLYTRCSNILNEHYFDKKFVKTVAFIKEYADTYGGLPPVDIIKAETKEDKKSSKS
jgi:hypothetical protein